MFILYAVVLGLALGLLLGGQASRLGELRIRFAWLCVAGLAVQLVLFSDAVTERIGDLGVPIYVASTFAVAAAVAANYRIPGMAVVALGAFSNLAAIVANGGYMPTTTEALAAAGFSEKTVYSNSALLADPRLPWLTDIFAMPPWIPAHNVFSVGDLLIGLGVVLVIVAAMRRPPVVASGAPAH
jgi:hypothetical protein